MYRLLAGAVFGGLLLLAPHPALAFDYAQPAVPEAFGGPAVVVVPVAPGGAALASPQSVPNDPPFVPHSPWEDGEGGGCALWSWNTC